MRSASSDTTGREVGDRVEGRLEFKGPSATTGYLRMPGLCWFVTTPLWIAVASAQRPPLARFTCHYAARLVTKLTAIRIGISGRDRLPSTPHILAVNHASYVDAILLRDRVRKEILRLSGEPERPG